MRILKNIHRVAGPAGNSGHQPVKWQSVKLIPYVNIDGGIPGILVEDYIQQEP
jgi:hypothetical protein